MKLFITCMLAASLIAASAALDPQDETPCQAHARRESAKEAIPGRLVPKCDAEGNYQPLQCFAGQTIKRDTWCSCWSKDGDSVSSPSPKTKHCGCFLERHSKTNSQASDVPVCEVSGEYQKMQCAGDSCKCVDPITGSSIEEGLTREQASAKCQ